MFDKAAVNVPQNRPPLSIPAKGVKAGVLHYLFWGSTFPVADLARGALTGNNEPLGDDFLPIMVLGVVPILIIAFGIRNGSAKILWLMWATAYFGAALVVFDLIAGLLVTFGVVGGGTHYDRSAGEFVLIASAVIGALCFFLLRTMRQVRWLDPRSTPDEWETPLRVGSGR